MRKLLYIVLAALFIFALARPLPALAIADPDTPPAINSARVYEFEDGSVGVLMDYYLDYAVPPTESASEAFIGVFVDTDGTTQLRATTPYVYVDDGYGRGLMWVQFTAAEAVSYSLDSADIADYRVWFVGNPALSWAGDPPKTISTLDSWRTSGTSTWLGIDVIYYADILELAWTTVDMVEATSAGNRLTSNGEEYFLNVIPELRTLAPTAFADTVRDPDYVAIDYDTTFGATVTSGTATIAGSPVTLSSGTTVINSGATTGTFTLDLADWTFGTVSNNTGTLAGSPASVYPGVNTLTITGAGTFNIAVAVEDTVTDFGDAVATTELDWTTLAARFGMSRWMFSGLIWLLISIVAAVAVYGATKKNRLGIDTSFGAKNAPIMIVMAIMLVGGTLLGLLHPVVSAMLFIAYGAFIGYVLFMRSESMHKMVSFMVFMFLVVSIAGNIVASGTTGVVATRLEENITSSETSSIQVASTSGFPTAGTIVIEDEQILYGTKDSTHFLGTTFNPMDRGAGSTEAVAHLEDATVRTKETWALNASVDYKIARITDSAGFLDYVSMPFRLLDLLVTFFKLPLEFAGTDMAILTYIWGVVVIGMIVSVVISIIGGRRV